MALFAKLIDYANHSEYHDHLLEHWDKIPGLKTRIGVGISGRMTGILFRLGQTGCK